MSPSLRRTRIASASASVLLGAMLVGGAVMSAATAASAGAATSASAAARAGTASRATDSPASTPAIPPWEPDPDSVGGLIFYNSSGQVITSGSVNASPIAAYVEGTTTIRAGDTRATLFGYLPVKGQTTGEFSGEQLGSSTPFPDADAPAPLNTSSLPVETGSSGDETIAQLEEDFPNTDTSGDGYAGMYQLRLRTSGPDEGLTITYDSADIFVTSTTWTVVYSPVPTTTTLSVSPKSGAHYGSTVKLSAAVSPKAAAGSVEFRDGSTLLKTVSVKAGKASYSADTLAGGVGKLSAKFVPTELGSYDASTSSVHDITISADSTTTSLSASKTTITEGQKLTLTAKVSPAAAGSVAFYDGTKRLAKVKVTKGVATYSSTKLAVGSHSLKAIFTPSDKADYKQSTSKVVTVTVKK